MKPFLKWVGGKRQLLPDIEPRIPASFQRYVEPFVGGGAVFFHLQPATGWINDLNPELVNCYQVVRDDVEALIAHLQQHIYEKDYYLEQRSLDRGAGGLSALSEVARASRFIYLNRTGFNGMYRVNAKGQFNVPFGRYKNPKIVDAPGLRACSAALRSVKITNLSYADVLAECGAGDFVYLDPPYVPLTQTSNFTQYADGGFDEAAQRDLAASLHHLNQRKIPFLASNAYAPLVLEIYEGLNIDIVYAKRAINSDATKRDAVREVLISNC